MELACVFLFNLCGTIFFFRWDFDLYQPHMNLVSIKYFFVYLVILPSKLTVLHVNFIYV
jgi:hypothetical protein